MFIMNYKSKLVFFLMSSLLEHDLSLLFNFRLRTVSFLMLNIINMEGEDCCSYCCYFCSSLLSFFLSFKSMIYYTFTTTEQVCIIRIQKTPNKRIAHHWFQLYQQNHENTQILSATLGLSNASTSRQEIRVELFVSSI